jgi:hypothetical protein
MPRPGCPPPECGARLRSLGGHLARRLAVQQSSPAPSKDVEEEPLTRYELLPRLTTRFTLAPRTSFLPALGLCEITRAFRTVFE